MQRDRFGIRQEKQNFDDARLPDESLYGVIEV